MRCCLLYQSLLIAIYSFHTGHIIISNQEVSMGTIQFDFSGEVAVVTGGSRGLGLEMAEAFGRAGASVVITARREQWLREAERQLKEQGISVLALLGDAA